MLPPSRNHFSKLILLLGGIKWTGEGVRSSRLRFADVLFHHGNEFCFRRIMSPGVTPMSLSAPLLMRCRISGPYPIVWRLVLYKCAFLTLRLVSAYFRNWGSFDGVLLIGERMTDDEVDFQEQVGVVGGLEGAWAMDATLERICEMWAKSLDTPLALPDAEVEADSEQQREGIDDFWLAGSNVSVCGGWLTDILPSYYATDEIHTDNCQRQVTYHCTGPFFHHERGQWDGISCKWVNVSVPSIMVIWVLLFQ